MDTKTKQQVIYANTLILMWVREGAELWSFSETKPVKTAVKIEGRYLNTDELADYAISLKRNGDYALAIGAYIRIMDAYKQETGKIPIQHVRGLLKVLLSVNCFDIAFCLVSTVCADMEQNQNVDNQEKKLFQKYFSELIFLSKMVVDNNDFSKVSIFAANYSGNVNYTLQRTLTEIKEDMIKIRKKVRSIYGI